MVSNYKTLLQQGQRKTKRNSEVGLPGNGGSRGIRREQREEERRRIAATRIAPLISGAVDDHSRVILTAAVTSHSAAFYSAKAAIAFVMFDPSDGSWHECHADPATF